MPNYIYVAKSFDGETLKGVLNAKDEHQLAQNLKGQGMVLISSMVEGKREKSRFYFDSPFFRVSLAEKIMITKNLGIMFATGLSLIKIFDILATQAKKKKLKKILLSIKDKVNKGENLSDALSSYPRVFSELYCNMVKVGEESGTLDEILQVLALQLEKEHELKSKIKNAMIYPSMIVMVMLVVAIIVVTFVLPSLNIFFTSLNVEIPVYTRIMLFLGDFLSQHWYLMIIVPLLFFIAFFLVLKTKKGKRAIDTFLLKMPVISSVVKKNNSAFLIRSLSSLIASGVPLIRSLEITSKTVSNHYFMEALVDAAKKIKKGEKLSNALKPYQDIFPVGVIEMMEVGEETGKTSVILKKLADFYEQEAVSAIERLTVIIEPMMIVMLGLAVGLFAFSIIQPMYSSLQSLQQ